MKAVGYERPLPINHPEALLDISLPEPVPAGHDILVEVKAVSVNPIDTKVRQRAAPDAGQRYKVLGWDASGIVRAVGPEVTLFQPGDRVWYAGSVGRAGCNSQLHLVDERIVGKAPRSLDFAQAAALPLTAITAWELLFDRFGIEVLATTESAVDDLAAHAKLAADGWGGPGGRVITTFRPDDVVDPEWAGWEQRLDRLAEMTGHDTTTYAGYIEAVRARREAFRAAGARSTDHGHPTAFTVDLDEATASRLFQRLRTGPVDPADAEMFRGHMLLRFAEMSVEDGLVMQLHPGAVRNHNTLLHQQHGRDVGGDIPRATEYTHALRPLLDRFGNDPRLRLVLYTLDETAFSRELAPLAGGYPAVFLGAPWWFLDTPDGLRRFREAVTDTAGFANTAGFVDDTRAFCSIPVRHQVARRVDAAYLARLVVEGRLDLDEAAEIMADLAYHLPKRVFRLDGRGA